MKLIALLLATLLMSFAPVVVQAAPKACIGSPASMLDAARSEMKSGLDRAIGGIRNEDPRAVDKLTEWLGVRSSDQEQRVLNVLIAARGLADSVTFVCDMVSDSNLFEDAVAIAANGHELLFTARYFSYPEIGVVSRPIILFHEMTHLSDVANTNADGGPKEVYTEAEVLRMVSETPKDAFLNAANYQYFLGDFLYGN